MLLPELDAENRSGAADAELMAAARRANLGVGVGGSPVFGLWPAPGREAAVLRKINAAADRAGARDPRAAGRLRVMRKPNVH